MDGVKWARRCLLSLAIVASLAQPPGARAVAAPVTLVLGWSPGVPDGVPPNAPLTVFFNRPMNQGSVEGAWHLSPAAAGSFRLNGAGVSFVPAHSLRSATVYHLSIGAAARSVSGLSLAGPFDVQFTTADALQVAGVSPAPRTQGVPATGRIAITFTHPMVPLQGLSAPSPVPAGWHLTIRPFVAGYGSWLNTSTWVFHPDSGLQPSTRYTVSLAGSARDAWGSALGHDLAWTFRTLTPELFNRTPRNGAQFVDPRTALHITFNQPMDPVSTARALAVGSGGATVAGRLIWSGPAVTFRPNMSLQGGKTYQVVLAPSARSINRQATLGRRLTWSFRVAPEPRILDTTPYRTGTAWASPSWGQYSGPYCCFDYGVSVGFSTPMDKTSLDQHLSIQPKVARFQTYFGGPDENGEFSYGISGDFKPSQHYTITITSGVHDAFGRLLAGSLTFPFKTSEMYPSVSLFGMPGQQGIAASAGQKITAPLQTVNVPTIHFTLIRTNLNDIARMAYGEPPSGTVIRRWSRTDPRALNKVQNPDVTVTQKDGLPLAPGLYWLDASASNSIPGWQGDMAYPYWPPHSGELVLVNNVSITVKTGGSGSLVWLNDIHTGKPLAGAQVRLADAYGVPLLRGTTDAQGLHWFPPFNYAGGDSVGAAVINDGRHFGLAYLGWQQSGVSPSYLPWYNWGNYVGSQHGSYAYTDRPVYRPGQRVDFRAVIWRDKDGVYSLLNRPTVSVYAQSSTGKRLYFRKLKLDRFGAVHGSFTLPAGVATGQAGIYIARPNRAGTDTSFTIADYRKPEFLTTVKAAKPIYAQGQTVEATATVRYVFGAPVIHQHVHWAAYAQTRFPQPLGWDTYTFADWEQLWSLWDIWSPTPPGDTALGKQIAQGNGRTDAGGRLVIHFPVNLAGELLGRDVIIEATATDANHQSVSGRSSLQTYRSLLAIGLRTDHETVPAGTPVTVDVAAVQQDGTPLPNRPLTADIFKRTYSSQLVTRNRITDWQQIPHDTLVQTIALTSDSQGKASLNFTPAQGGEYRVRVEGKDDLGNLAKMALSIYSSAAGFSDWGNQETPAIPLKPDKQRYQVGDTAHILVPAPFGNASALVTVERGTIRRFWVTHFATNSSTVDVPIRLTDVPNEYVTVTIYHGWQGTNPPEWRSGTAELHVQVDPRHLQVRLTQSGTRHHPGDPVTYTVSTTDMHGKPVSAQLSIALVDTSVLALSDEVNADILQAFYSEIPLGVSTASEGTLSIDHLKARPDSVVQPNGAGQPLAIPAPVRAGSAASDANAAAQAAPSKVSAGGGGSPAQAVTVRSNFADTAVWRGSVQTDAAGRATIHVHLPDNATTWRLDARGLTASTQVGQADLSTLATRDLVLRPLLPRFLVQGDHLRLGVALNNRLNRPVIARVSAQAKGLQLSSQPITVSLPARGERVVVWPAIVPVSDLATFTARATPTDSTVQGDAVQLSIPVHPPLTDETVATAGEVYGTIRQAIIVPRHAVSFPGALTVRVQSSLIAGLGAALGQFKPSIYDSNDDVAARVLVASSLHSLQQPITGLSKGTYRSLPATTSAGIQLLLSKEWYDGGWPWYTDYNVQQSDPFTTADVVQALVASGRNGRAVQTAISRGRQFLASQLRVVPASLRAHLLAVLATSGGAPVDRVTSLYSHSITRYHLDSGPLADLGLALKLSRSAGKAHTIVASLQSTARVSATGAHWESADPYFYGGPPIGATAEVLASLLRLSPHDPLEPAAARWLMLARQGDGWDCNHDTAQAIFALAAYARAAREGTADYSYRVSLGGRTGLSGRYTPANNRRVATMKVPVSMLPRSAADLLDIGRSGANGSFGAGPLYYVAQLHYFLNAVDIAPRSEGVTVHRRFLDLQGRTVTQVKAGSALKVQLTIHTDQTLVYLNVQDPIPAGCEPIDESLNTSQRGLFGAPRWLDWWPWRPNAVQDLSWFLLHSELHDDHVSLYAYSLPPGTYRYTYLLEATVSGRYEVAPTHVSETFFPEVFGRSRGQELVVQ